MSTDFSRTLSLLRKEKHISQRKAADAMGISQALLSHYENGIREPGLAFVVKACDYYQVSADYLLGRTMDKDGAMIEAQELYDVSEHKDNSIRGNIMAQLNKKLMVNSVSLIYSVLGRLGSRDLIMYVSNYLSCALYIVYRDLYSINPQNHRSVFKLDEVSYRCGAVDTVMSRDKTDLQLEMAKIYKDKSYADKLAQITSENLIREFPALRQSLFQVIHNTGSRTQKMLEIKSTDK